MSTENKVVYGAMTFCIALGLFLAYGENVERKRLRYEYETRMSSLRSRGKILHFRVLSKYNYEAVFSDGVQITVSAFDVMAILQENDSYRFRGPVEHPTDIDDGTKEDASLCLSLP